LAGERAAPREREREREREKPAGRRGWRAPKKRDAREKKRGERID
jgi:hypothetical protein